MPKFLSHAKALKAIQEQFQRFPLEEPPRLIDRWSRIPHEMDDLLVHALGYLFQSLDVTRAAVFFMDHQSNTLMARQVGDRGHVMAGEEEIVLVPHSSLDQVIKGQKDLLAFQRPTPTLYLPLRAFGYTCGVLRVEGDPSRRPFRTAHRALLQEFSHELAMAVRGLEMVGVERHHAVQLQTLHEVSNAIFQSLRLEEMLQAVAKCLIERIGFDRTKIFLLNKEGEILERVLALDHLQRQDASEGEKFPMRRGVHPMVDLILGKTQDERLEKFQGTLLYLPLRTRDENLGVLMVDNLLSQQDITPEQVRMLRAIAGQMAMAIKNARLFQGVEELSITDSLTGLYLLRYFKQRLKEEFYRAERTHGHLSLMIMDIDHFKRFNDTYGHPSGDAILSTVAERVLANARKIDLIARYGGDEFVILSPDTTAEEALLLADRLHQAVSKDPLALPGQTVVHLTVSIGVATYPTHANSIEELIKRSDDAMYWIKAHGRNRICLYDPRFHHKPPSA